jgi:hypothetical protein
MRTTQGIYQPCIAEIVNAFTKTERRCAIRTQSKRSVQSSRKNNKHVNQWATVHEPQVLKGDEIQNRAIWNATVECITHYNGNVSAYKADIHKDAKLTRETVRVYIQTLKPIAKDKRFPRYDHVVDYILRQGYEECTWTELRALSKQLNANAGKTPKPKSKPRTTAKVTKIVNSVKRENPTNKEIDAVIRELRSLKK